MEKKKYSTRRKATLAAKLVELCIEVTANTKADAWFEYSANVDWLEVGIYPEGWRGHEDEAPQMFRIGFKEWNDTEAEVKAATDALKAIRKGAE